jgi:Protein of unknown function (DUF3109)
MIDMPRSAITSYPHTESLFKTTLSAQNIEWDSFTRPLRQCDTRACGGMCCYDGVYVNDESEQVISTLWRTQRAFFKTVGIQHSGDPIITAEWNGAQGKKTATKPRALSHILNNYPSHFNDTACVFLTPSSQCALQLLAVHEGRHKWYYKPITCVLHPIHVSLQEKRVFLADRVSDPHNLPEYPGFSSRTTCGETVPDGPPAVETLREELDFLLSIIGHSDEE